MALPSWLLVSVGGRRSQRLGPSPALGSLGPSHQWCHKSRVSLWAPPCAHGVVGTPHGEVHGNCLQTLTFSFVCWAQWLANPNCWIVTLAFAYVRLISWSSTLSCSHTDMELLDNVYCFCTTTTLLIVYRWVLWLVLCWFCQFMPRLDGLHFIALWLLWKCVELFFQFCCCLGRGPPCSWLRCVRGSEGGAMHVLVYAYVEIVYDSLVVLLSFFPFLSSEWLVQCFREVYYIGLVFFLRKGD